MSTQVVEQFVNIKIYDFIHLDPTTIRSLYADQKSQRVYIAREKYSQICQIDTHSQQQPVLQQIAELEPCQYILQIDGILALFKPFQLKIYRNNRWEYHSFTTQLLSIRVHEQNVYSFHEKQTILWHFSQDNFSYKFLNESHTPYHLDANGSIVGQGKKVQSVFKGLKLTTCNVIANKWFFVGDDKGGLHVYDWKLLSHVKTFHEHEGPIMAIKVDQNSSTVYFSGCDSKVSFIRLIGNDWKLGNSCRGQSHDVLSLQLFGNYLLGGGVTTDICFYPLVNGQLSGEYTHKVSYTSSNRVDSQGKIIVSNNRNGFQIWQMGSNLYRTKLLVKYEMPNDKYIIDCKLFHEAIEENTHLLLVVTDEDTVGWKFNPDTGLVKFITIQNQYVLTQLLSKHIFLGVRSDGLVQKVNCRTGKIQELIYCQVELPTDLKYLGSGLLLIGSKLTRSINILNIRKKDIFRTFNLDKTYTYVEHVEADQLLIQYFNNPILYKFSFNNQEQTELVTLPVTIIRFGGWLANITRAANALIKSKPKKYWYCISEGKIVIIPNLMKDGKKKIRVRQTDRIAQVVKSNSRMLGCNLAIIPYNFKRMIDQLPIKPIFTKKIV